MSEFIGEIENGIRHALKTKRHVKVLPQANGMCGSLYSASVAAGFRWEPCRTTAYASELAQPCDHWVEKDGTIHAVQWEML
jgi:hypothetical protein